MQVSAGIRQSWGLNHYGEFDSFEKARAHLEAEGWECVGRFFSGASWRWEYWRSGELLMVREDASQD